MKRVILLLLCAAALQAKAQTIDTAKFKGFAVVRIATPFVVKWNDTTKARYLGVTSISDNLKSNSMFSYTLYSASGRSIDGGVIECKDADYQGWSGDNKFPFSFVANKLNLSIK